MEDLNQYMEKPKRTSLTSIKEMTQNNINRKEAYLSKEPIKVLTANELNDDIKRTDAYQMAIIRNDEVIDFIIDVKNDIFKIKLVRESLDRNTAIGAQQARQLDYYISLLNDILSILMDERSKLDRIVRYNEKTYSSFYRDY